MPVLMNRNQNMASRDEDKSMISRVQTNISRRLMYIKQWERIPNAWVRQLSGMKKSMDERGAEFVLRSFWCIESVK